MSTGHLHNHIDAYKSHREIVNSGLDLDLATITRNMYRLRLVGV